MAVEAVLGAEQLRAYVEYLRDLGVYEFYHREGEWSAAGAALADSLAAASPAVPLVPAVKAPVPRAVAAPVVAAPSYVAPVAVKAAVPVVPVPVAPAKVYAEPAMAKLLSFDELVPVPTEQVAPADRAAALKVIQDEIGDCTRCPLAYGGRHKIVFADGAPTARLMFLGEGPGADEDASGVPFVGKAGQLLNNMIAAMGLKREEVYIANIVKCRPPGNRTPEPVEAGTCSQFLIRQIDVVKPEVIVALGATAATYLLGKRQSLGSMRGEWFKARGAKVAVTYHPAFLLRDPRQKGEAWKDLQRVMGELGLKGPSRG
ncbi:DNA polymerase [Granulicella pectinivorans]|uniref:Type-4 uracil-DNA glycosylase n=1 Tax=Granulicella pectinivorans TaxID=474950 RepID=A0A1I6M7W9_9BACT|nr:uracil-DNA glycosylase [Granulicella pectinivorans]SFS11820.1 DNA polymerase [Granulicella pectinivorans]